MGERKLWSPSGSRLAASWPRTCTVPEQIGVRISPSLSSKRKAMKAAARWTDLVSADQIAEAQGVGLARDTEGGSGQRDGGLQAWRRHKGALRGKGGKRGARCQRLGGAVVGGLIWLLLRRECVTHIRHAGLNGGEVHVPGLVHTARSGQEWSGFVNHCGYT